MPNVPSTTLNGSTHGKPSSNSAKRHEMTKRPFELAVLIVGAILVVLLALGRGGERQTPVSVYSTYDTGPNGYRAVYEVLRRAGVPVRRYERELGALDSSVKTIVITGYEDDPSAKPLDERDADYLKHFVQTGGRLVAVDAMFVGSNDVTPGVGVSQRARAMDAVTLAGNAYTAGVSRVRGTIGWIFPFKEAHGIPLLANGHGMIAVLYRVGRGEVVAITAPALFSNEELRNADNVRLAYNAVAGHGQAVFDEYIHGYDDRLTTWAVLPWPVRSAVWIIAGLVALALIGANVPFAPPYLPTPPDERDSSDYITAIAELMRRSRTRPSDADVLREAIFEFQRRKEHA
jgi:Domain of unknown function (DUF4350)